MGFEQTRGGTYFSAARTIVAMFLVTRTTARCVATSASKEKDAVMEFVPMFCPMLITVASATRGVHLVIHVGVEFVAMHETKLLKKFSCDSYTMQQFEISEDEKCQQHTSSKTCFIIGY